MLEEFILDQLSKLTLRKEELAEKLTQLTEEEQRENEAITQILSKDHFNFELFSPRSAGHGVKQEVEAVHKRIEALRFQQAEVREKLEETNESELKYQKLLYEARNKNPDVTMPEEETDNSDDTNDTLTGDENNQITLKLVDDEGIKILKETHLKELENILDRVNICFDLSQKDRIRCKNELNNLRYYLKARISDMQE